MPDRERGGEREKQRARAAAQKETRQKGGKPKKAPLPRKENTWEKNTELKGGAASEKRSRNCRALKISKRRKAPGSEKKTTWEGSTSNKKKARRERKKKAGKSKESNKPNAEQRRKGTIKAGSG